MPSDCIVARQNSTAHECESGVGVETISYPESSQTSYCAYSTKIENSLSMRNKSTQGSGYEIGAENETETVHDENKKFITTVLTTFSTRLELSLQVHK